MLKPKRKRIELKPVRPSAALRSAYQAKLEAELDAMNRSLNYWVLAAYRASPPELAQDESPARAMLRTVRRVGRRWRSRFDELSPKLAEYFATNAADRVDGALKEMLRDHGFTVQFKMTAAQNDAYQAVVGENVGLIKSLATKHLGEVEGLVMRSVQTGRDLGTLSKALQENYGVTKRRAGLIARTQNNMATATLTRTRQTQLGITKAKWLHSAGGKHPRVEHKEASGKEYDVTKGMYLEGVWTWPGREIGCRCVSVPLIDGFEE